MDEGQRAALTNVLWNAPVWNPNPEPLPDVHMTADTTSSCATTHLHAANYCQLFYTCVVHTAGI